MMEEMERKGEMENDPSPDLIAPGYPEDVH